MEKESAVLEDLTDSLEEDSHLLHLWEPLPFEVDSHYEFLPKNLLFHLFSTLLSIIALPILYFFNKICFGFRIHGIQNLTQIKGAKITVSNHVHPMDCTMNGILSAPRRVFFPTLQNNFKIPVVKQLIKLFHAIPIPKTIEAKKEFTKSIHSLLQTGHIVHFYPEASLWPYYPKLRHFKNGAFRFAVENNTPIVPIVYTFVKPHGTWKLYKTKPCIEATVLPAFFPCPQLEKKEAISKLKEDVYTAMNSFLTEHREN